MANYSLKFKLKIINESKKGKNSVNNIAKINKISSSTLQNWIKLFDKKGIDGISRTRINNKYNQDFELMIVKEYLTSEISYSDLAIKYNIPNYSLIAAWKLEYEKNGIMGLQNKKRGRSPTMTIEDTKKDNRSKQEKIDDKQKIKELETKLEILRAQNALLKKYQALGIPIPESMLKEI